MSIVRSIACSAASLLLGPLTVVGTPDVAIGTFHRNLAGISVFTGDGGNVRVTGTYAGLKANRSYFTVVYGNRNCDPAQAFPVGPFTTDGRGRGSLVASVPGTVDVGKTGSVSVRRGDNDSDIDGDGITGPGDVVAVAGKPGIGLIECDGSPLTRDN